LYSPLKTRDRRFRRKLKHGEVAVSSKVILDTMFELSLIVEEKIKKILHGKKVALLHDGWSRYSVHYLCVLVSFMEDPKRNERISNDDKKASLLMLSLTTLSSISDDDEEDGDKQEAIDFTAATHVAHIKDVCKRYDLGIETNVACCIADNTAVNPKIARELGSRHVACRNHALNTAGKCFLQLFMTCKSYDQSDPPRINVACHKEMIWSRPTQSSKD
jgi:hypothetical protein